MTYAVGTASLVCIMMTSGCALWQNEGGLTSGAGRKLDKALWEQNSFSNLAPGDDFKIANPPAKTIRFDGREVALETSDVTQIAANDFSDKLSSLLNENKYFTASTFVAKNIDTAEQILWHRWAIQPDSAEIRFLAEITSRGVTPSASWNAMLARAKENPVAARRYHAARTNFAQTLSSEDLSNDEREQLRMAAQQVKRPLATIDALRLMAIRELGTGRHAWAESLLLQAIKLAEQNENHARVADLWLLVAMHSNRSGEQSMAMSAWEKAVTSQAKVHFKSERSIHVGFWTNAERYRPRNAKWPRPAKQALLALAMPVGCKFSESSSTALIIWTAVGNSQLDTGQPQRALINFKKAETFASGEDTMWLRIAQSECLAALGQTQAAAALLSEPLAGNNPTVAAAANAALGSAKLQASAFQQGAHLLNKALHDSTLDWPTRSHAEGDLALAMLIIGKTDQGLKALHGTQSKFEIQGDVVALLQSLENELRLLEYEGRLDAANTVRRHVLEIERRPVP